MSTSPIEPSEFVRPGAKEPQLDVHVAIRKGNEWKTPDWNETDQLSIQSAVQTIKDIGMQHNAKVFGEFNKSGAKLELSQRGIFVQKKGKWKNLLEDPNLSTKAKAELTKTLKGVSSVLGELGSKRSSHKAEVSSEAQKLEGRSGLVVEVTVVTQQEKIIKKIHQQAAREKKFAGQVGKLNQWLQSATGKNAITSKGLSLDQVDNMRVHCQDLAGAAGVLMTEMQEVKRLLNDGKISEAMKKYDDANEAYAELCDAMRLWQNDQRLLLRQKALSSDFEIDLDHPHFQQELAYLISTMPSEEALELKHLKEVMAYGKSYKNFVELQRNVTARMDLLLNEEQNFNEDLGAAQIFLKDPINHTSLKSYGWSDAEIQDHSQKIDRLKKQSDKILNDLIDANALIAEGKIQEGMDHLSKQMVSHFDGYVDALAALDKPQRVAQGRTFLVDQRNVPFSYDLSHAKRHMETVHQIAQATHKAEVIDSEHEKVLDEASWLESVEKMRGSVSKLDALKSTALISHINGRHQAFLQHHQRLGKFTAQYANYREFFELTMRKHGLSSLESAFIFNHLIDTQILLQQWDRAFQKVVDLANQGKTAEALEEYATLMIDYYPRFVQQEQKALFSSKSLGQENVQRALKEFSHFTAINYGELLPLLVSEKMVSRTRIAFEEALSLATKEGISIPAQASQATATITTQLSQFHEQLDVQGSLLAQNQRLYDFFLNPTKSKNNPDHVRWSESVVEAGWSKETITKFTQLQNRYAALIRPLKEAELAIAAESNPQKKRALESQFKELIIERAPEIAKLESEIEKMGGIERMASLPVMVQAFIEKINLEKDYADVKTWFSKNKIGIPFSTHEELIAGVERLISNSSEDMQKTLKNVYKGVLPHVQKINFSEGLKKEAEVLAETMQSRHKYFNHCLATVNRINSWEFGSVGRAFLDTPFANDPDFLTILEAQGWDPQKIADLNQWYDAYMIEALPLRSAKDALDADPENPILQEGLKLMAKKHIPKLNQLIAEFKQKFGTTSAVGKLKTALEQYHTDLKASHKSTTVSLSGELSIKLKRKAEKNLQQMNNYLSALERLPDFNVAEVIRETDANRWNIAILAQEPMSWDRDYLDLLVNKKSPLLELKNVLLFEEQGQVKGSLWNHYLVKNGLNEGDVSAINRLYQNYVKELRHIAVLERALERKPEDHKTHEALVKELRAHQLALKKLGREYTILSEKITKLDQALSGYHFHLKKALDAIETAERTPDNTQQIGEERKRRAGNLTNEAIRQLIRRTNNLSVGSAFEQKRALLSETYGRFSPEKLPERARASASRLKKG